jgi:hypothetical protein
MNECDEAFGQFGTTETGTIDDVVHLTERVALPWAVACIVESVTNLAILQRNASRFHPKFKWLELQPTHRNCPSPRFTSIQLALHR